MIISNFQFIISKSPFLKPLENGVVISHNGLNIQVSNRSVHHLICTKEVVFFGECFDYENPKFSNEEIINSFENLTFQEVNDKIGKLSGFFIFLFFEGDNTFIFNDASSQLETYIYDKEGQFYCSCQPNLILPFLDDEHIYDEKAPSYIVEDKINIFGKTPFNGIEKLIPNFYYDVNLQRSIRIFPVQPFEEIDIASISLESIHILEQTIESLLHRKEIAIGLTAGWDSRLLFAASLKQNERVNYFVLQHNSPDGKVDVEISTQIARTFEKKLNVIDYESDLTKVTSKEKAVIWKDDDRAHKTAQVMNLYYPNAYIVNGNISEVVRNYYDPLPKNSQ